MQHTVCSGGGLAIEWQAAGGGRAAAAAGRSKPARRWSAALRIVHRTCLQPLHQLAAALASGRGGGHGLRPHA